jgi:glycosyltransferase involved in cell wall biosynthesis
MPSADEFVSEGPAEVRPEGDVREGVTATLLIATYNRASLLQETLQTVAALRTPHDVTWDVVIVDNNSNDHTRDMVAAAAGWFPVPLTYIFEPRQGKSVALNTALTAISSSIILFSDDDVRVPGGWLEAAVRPLVTRTDIAYVGGPVSPLWGGAPPPWLQDTARHAGVLAILDYGPDAFVFEERRVIPLGVNMAVRRALIEQVGGFHGALDRRGAALLGQGQAEFFLRCRRFGARGLYVPAMNLEHVVPLERLSMRYFSRWWFWKGVSHARWYRIHGETELGVDLTRVPRLLGIPLYLYRSALADAAAACVALARGRTPAVAQHCFMLAYFAGYVRESWFGQRNVSNQLPPAGAARRRGGVPRRDPPAPLRCTPIQTVPEIRHSGI